MYGFSLYSTFTVWNTLTSPVLQTTKYVEKESNGEESDQPCYMVQGNDSLEVNSSTDLDDCASSSSDDYVDADVLIEELSLVCENLLEKYQVLKKKSLKIRICFQNLIWLCKREMRFQLKGTL